MCALQQMVPEKIIRKSSIQTANYNVSTIFSARLRPFRFSNHLKDASKFWHSNILSCVNYPVKMILKKCFALFIMCIVLQSCKKNKVNRKESTEPVDRMVLIYVAANNNLKFDALKSINKMEQGVNALKGNLLVFIKTNSNSSHLLKIKYDNSDVIISDTLKTYGNTNSSDPDFLKEVINDSRHFSPAETYGLVMWSHATSWAPPANLKTKSFGNDNGEEMDIKGFRDAIPSDFEYIMFDACSMGSLEVVYELRKKAKYILASPSEVLSSSFPYDSITPHLFGDSNHLKIICRQFIEYYSSFSGLEASATVSLIETNNLETLSSYINALLTSTKPKSDFNINKVQRMDFENQLNIPAYDFISFLEQNFDPKQYAEIEIQLGKVVVYKDHTKNFFNVPINTFSGLSVYVPRKNDPLMNYYKKLSWASASGWNNLFQ